jgi:1,6-anhydro-N-acetylmuramate kinase
MLIHPPPTSATIIGMMSGTSVDSIDAVLCELTVDPSGRISASLTGFYEHPISDHLRERIFRLFSDPAGALALTCSLNFEIGAAFAEAARVLLDCTGRRPDDIDAVASHGQTVWHIPPHAARAGEAVERRWCRSPTGICSAAPTARWCCKISAASPTARCCPPGVV